jgi:hypothetical protein
MSLSACLSARQLIAGAILSVAGLFAAVPACQAQITFGHVDDFEEGNTANWSMGHPEASPTLALGGPLGAADHYLFFFSDGVSLGGKLTMFNRNQWAGNYVANAVTRIEMDLKALATSGPLSIRLAFRSSTGSAADGYASTTGFSLPLDNQWHHVVFNLSAMTKIGNPAPLATLLANAPELRILSGATPTLQGDTLVAQIGVDNIAAVPEPASAFAAALLLGLFTLRRRVQTLLGRPAR